MELNLRHGEKITVIGSKGRFGAYVVLEGINGEVLCKTDAQRDIYDEAETETQADSNESVS